MTTTVKTCSCKHEFQDKRYGPQKRVMNALGEKKQHQGIHWRCTVCKREHA